MEGLLASVVLIAILLSVMLMAGGLVYLVARRAQRLSRRSSESVILRPRPLLGCEPWFGPGSGGYPYSPASPEGHAVGLVGIAGAVYLAQADQVLGAAAVAVAMVFIVFVKCTPPAALRYRRNSTWERSATRSAGH